MSFLTGSDSHWGAAGTVRDHAAADVFVEWQLVEPAMSTTFGGEEPAPDDLRQLPMATRCERQ